MTLAIPEDVGRKKTGHLAEDLHRARQKRPNDPHLKDAVVAFLSGAKPACEDPDHKLCVRVKHAARQVEVVKDMEDND